MQNTKRYQNLVELLQGTMDLLILQTLLWGPQHGYGISQVIRSNSGDVLQVDTGSLYPALHRLHRQAWISSEWQVLENHPPGKGVCLYPVGRQAVRFSRPPRTPRLSSTLSH